MDEYRQQKISSINQIRDSLIHGGITFQGNRFQTRERDIQDMMGALQIAQVAAAQNQIFSTNWLTEDNVQVLLDLPTLTALGVAVAEHKRFLVYKAREHKDNLMLLNSKEDIDAYYNSMVWTV